MSRQRIYTSQRGAAALLPLLAVWGCESEQGIDVGYGGRLATAIEEIRIGAVDDPEFAFGGVIDLEVGADGTIFTLHRQESTVRRWTPDGRSAGTIGRGGEGPGEFVNPRTLGWKGDSLWVFDSSRNSRITFFSADGTYQGVLSPRVDIGSAEQASQGVYPPRPAGLLADGSIYGATPGFSRDIVEGTVTRIVYVRMSQEGRTLDTLITRKVGRESVLGLLRGGGGTFTSQPFGDGTIVLVEKSGSSLLALERKASADRRQGEFRLHRVNLAGDTVLTRSYAYRPIPIPADTIDGAVESIAERLHTFGGEQMGSTLMRMRGSVREAMYVPEHYAPISEMLAGRDGTIWLARSPEIDQGVEWQILGQDGESIAKVVLPQGVRVLSADTSAVWGVVRDDLGVEYIVRYRLEFGSPP